MTTPPVPDIANWPHRAIGLHLKRFDDYPEWVWHNDRQEWLRADNPLLLVDVYEDQARGWFLRYGEQLTQDHNAGFIVLLIAVSYLEANQQYREGASSKSRSGEMVIAALRRLFPSLSQESAKRFYDVVRCGLFHDGMTRTGVDIENRFPNALEIDPKTGEILVSPNKFMRLVLDDFEAYLVDLRREGSQSLSKFLSRWDR